MDVCMRPDRFHAFHADTVIAKGCACSRLSQAHPSIRRE